MATTSWAFPIYFNVFKRWSKDQTKLVGGLDLAHGLTACSKSLHLNLDQPCQEEYIVLKKKYPLHYGYIDFIEDE